MHHQGFLQNCVPVVDDPLHDHPGNIIERYIPWESNDGESYFVGLSYHMFGNRMEIAAHRDNNACHADFFQVRYEGLLGLFLHTEPQGRGEKQFPRPGPIRHVRQVYDMSPAYLPVQACLARYQGGSLKLLEFQYRFHSQRRIHRSHPNVCALPCISISNRGDLRRPAEQAAPGA